MKEKFDILNEYGEFTDIIKTRKEVHEKGLWHRAVVLFIINDKNEVLLQKRSATKKMWPNLWDITAGGHVLSGEFGYQAILREAKEEINLNLTKEELIFIGSTISKNSNNGLIDNHFNEFYIVHKNIDIKNLTIDKEEVSDLKWISKKELLRKLNNNYEDLTTKKGCWEYLEKYFSMNL